MAKGIATSEIPSDCGKRLMPHYIHQTAIDEPHRVCISTPLTSEPRDGFEDITFSQLDKAIDVASVWVEEQLGIGKNFPCIAYIGPHDLRYILLTMAAIKTGHKLFAPSTRNSLEAHVKLLNDYHCEKFLFAEDSPISHKIVHDIRSQAEFETMAVPTLDYFLHPSFEVPHYKYAATFDEAKFWPFIALQTSGTTGMPKPIVVPHGLITSFDAFQKVPSMYGLDTTYEPWRNLRTFSSFPLFHMAGIAIYAAGVYFNQIVVLPPPVPLSAKMANEVHVHGKVQASILPPSVLVEISKVPEYLDNLSHLTSIMTGGGPVPKGPGDLISSRTYLFVAFGSTECGHISSVLPPRENWDYFDFSPAIGVEMRHHSDEFYELVTVRDPSLEAYQGIFYTFPDLSEHNTHDLFSKHPTKKNLWRHEGRSDDIIVYSTGENFNPISMESHLNSHPEVKAAIVYGAKKFQSTLLIEPFHPEKSREALLNEIWPEIQSANASCPAHARIMSKDFVTFARADKPLPRAGKGTVQRKMALKLYEEELNSLYETKPNGNDTNGNHSTPRGTNDDLQHTIVQAVSSLQGFEKFSPSENWFDLGMDSLGVITLTRALNSAFQSHNPPRTSISETMIYTYPSAEKLASALSGTGEDKQRSQDEMKEEFERYVFDLPIVARPSAPVTGPRVFLLTGSTGSLGSYILNSLLEDKSCKVYCLNRGEDSEERQRASSSSKGLPTDFERVKFFSMATGAREPWLGMKIDQYKMLQYEVTHIIHNAWQVDFNVSLEQLGATHIRRVRQLIDFSAHSRYGCSIHFISSISSVGNWSITSGSPQGRVPEVSFEDWSLPQGAGYGQAKFVAERLLATACSVSNIPVSIYRVGQIAGPKSSKGKWNEQEWFPSIVRSSKYLGALPSSLGPMESVDWIPVDLFGKVIYELLSSSPPQSPSLETTTTNSSPASATTIYHVVNPKHTTYSDALLPRLKSLLDLPTVSFEEWVHRLRDSAAKTRDTEIVDNPAVKLLSFYEGQVSMWKEGKSQVQLETEKTVEGSPTLKSMDAIDGECMDIWVRQWGNAWQKNKDSV
ncbi:hypothetical protein DSL72_006509 [Monilinia vaccinii-corymbosi]|uniref:Carrier domain-containing protein n=1 Tax=Monilinia vaccinii-corymbosi TaxID=61207 RepID=A0A8A3PMK8_9HELO|nr:hypothetical protein DSL72_006509 [Monilinia vaccinii-corymbosi]